MYSPKIDEQLIPRLYKLKQITKKPMTKMVNEAITQYLERRIYRGSEENGRSLLASSEASGQSSVQGVLQEKKEEEQSQSI